MRTCISIGDYTTTPYCIPGLEIPVYCVEELCYCIRENAFLLDRSLMSDELVKWIEDECELSELADNLFPLIHRQGSLSTFVTMILEYVGLYDGAVIRDVEQVLKRGAGLSGIEKRKRQIDYMVEKKKYVTALKGYDALLAKWDEQSGEHRGISGNVSAELPAAEVKAAIFHNKGVALAHMMRYAQAAECFLQAAEVSRRVSEYVAYLAAKRMELSEGDYIAFAAGLSGDYDSALQLEKTLERVQRGWEEQVSYKRLAARKSWREESDWQKYHEENERLTQVLKDNYRDSMSE